MLLRRLPEKGYTIRGGIQMEMLVTKFSNGKYRNQGELFAETFGVRTCYLELLYERYGKIGGNG